MDKPLTAYRQEQGKSLGAAADELGLASKGYLSRLERGETRWPIRLALVAHRWSGGAVPAESLVDREDAELLRDYLRLQRQAAA